MTLAMAAEGTGPGGANGMRRTFVEMLRVLSDGKEHPREDLYPCLADELSREGNSIYQHIALLRKLLRERGEDLLCRKGMYQHVILVPAGTAARRSVNP